MQATPRGHAADPNTSPAFGFKKEERRKQPTAKLRTCLRQKKNGSHIFLTAQRIQERYPRSALKKNPIETTRSENSA
jgi:hypothetical protein